MKLQFVLPVCLLFIVGCTSMETPATTLTIDSDLIATEKPGLASPSPSIPVPTSTETPVPSPTPIPHDQYTGAILGGDFDVRRPERNRFGVRSDVFLLYVFDHYPTQPERNQMSLISLPRDLWLDVPCSPLDPVLQGRDRVNAAWAYGGFECVQDMIETNFDLEVNAPKAFTDFDGFMWLVARLGAVQITPNQTYTDWCGNYHGTDGTRGNYITWYEGQTYNMGPNEALCYSRGRKGHPTGDLDRNRRGLEMAQALGEQYAAYLFDTWDPANVASEFFAFMIDGQRYVDLDVSVFDAVKFAGIVGDAAVADRRVIRFTLDETEFWTTPVYGASVLRPTVDVRRWIDCMIRRQLPMDIMDGILVCTDVTRIEAEER